MNTVLFQIQEMSHLQDDSVIEELMDAMLTKTPQLHGYTYERCNGLIQIMIWGDIEMEQE